MGQNTNSLVGVAISASLLPPCVNTGLLFAEAALDTMYFAQDCVVGNQTYAQAIEVWNACCTRNFADACISKLDVPYPDYCCTSAFFSEIAFGMMGFISFLLTLVNITCIVVFASLTFYFKEVAPLPNKSELWSSILPQARRFNQAAAKGEHTLSSLHEDLGEELSHAPLIGQGGLQTRAIGETGFSQRFRFKKNDSMSRLFFETDESEEETNKKS
jgi:hypothetical protein